MEIFLKNRLSFTDKITFLPCRAAFPFVNTCVPANTRVLGKCLTSLLALQAPPTPPHPAPWGWGWSADSADAPGHSVVGFCLVWRPEWKGQEGGVS